jgi:hypothetical protein
MTRFFYRRMTQVLDQSKQTNKGSTMRLALVTSISLSGLLAARLAIAEPAAAYVPPTATEPAAPSAVSLEPAAPVAAPVPAAVQPAETPFESTRQSRRRMRVLGERTAYNAVYLELLGAGVFYSLNYDRRIGDVAVRLGGMYVSLSAANSVGDSVRATWIGVPISVSYLGIGSERNCLEIGAGVTINHFSGAVDNFGVKSNSDSATAFFGHGIIGFRHQPLGGGFFFRAGLSPIIGSGFWLPWPHVGLGGTF